MVTDIERTAEGLTFHHPLLFCYKICSSAKPRNIVCLIYLYIFVRLSFSIFMTSLSIHGKFEAGESDFHRPSSFSPFSAAAAVTIRIQNIKWTRSERAKAKQELKSKLWQRLGPPLVGSMASRSSEGRLEQHLSKMSKYFQILDRFPGVLLFQFF